MKTCVNCYCQIEDDQSFCPVCGAQQPYPNPNPQAAPQYPPQPQYAYDIYDHTAEFDPRDISDNKCYAMLIYLLGWVGIVIALLASHDSPYLQFHIRQAIKITVCMSLLVILMIIPIVNFVAAICIIILLVLKIIAFFQICTGKAKEPAIVRSLGFLK